MSNQENVEKNVRAIQRQAAESLRQISEGYSLITHRDNDTVIGLFILLNDRIDKLWALRVEGYEEYESLDEFVSGEFADQLWELSAELSRLASILGLPPTFATKCDD